MNSSQYQKTIQDLQSHQYHKLIIGAALKDYEAIEKYSYYFTHAAANVIDISAFPHSLISAKKGIQKALEEDSSLSAPIIMVSVNVGKDPHFRRIEVDFKNCTDCLACVPTCPSEAFSITDQKLDYEINLCFACSKCIEYCNFDALHFKDWSAFKEESLLELIELGAGAIEIHLNNDLDAFRGFYKSLPEFPEKFLQSFSIGSEMMSKEDLENAALCIIETVREKYGAEKEIIIQTDGIPISGALEIKDKDLTSIENAKVVIKKIKNEKNVFVQLMKKV